MPTNELHTYQPRQEQDLPEGVAEQAECAGRVQHDLGLNNEPANLNNAIVDDEGGGRADDRSRRGDDSAADGSAQAAQERLLNQQIGNVTPWGMTGRRGGGGGTAERRRRSASEPRGKGFRDIGVHTGQLPEGADRCAVAEKPEIEAMIAPLPLGESPASKPKGNDIPGAIAEGFQTMTIPPVPERVVCDPAEYITGRKLSKCSSGKVYVGRLIDMPGGAYNGRNAYEVVLKFEHRKSRAGCYDAPLEWKVYLTLNGCYGIPSVHYMGRQGDYHILIMDMLGPNLWDVRDSLEQKKMPFQMVARIAVEAISIIEKIHSKGFVHGDVKPENLLLGQPGSAQENKLFLINFGLGMLLHKHPTGNGKEDHPTGNGFSHVPAGPSPLPIARLLPATAGLPAGPALASLLSSGRLASGRAPPLRGRPATGHAPPFRWTPRHGRPTSLPPPGLHFSYQDYCEKTQRENLSVFRYLDK